MIQENSDVLKSMTLTPSIHYGLTKLRLPSHENDSFHAMLGIDENKKIIPNSNSFLVDYNPDFRDFKTLKIYDDQHHIFSNIEKNYEFLKNCDVDIQDRKSVV